MTAPTTLTGAWTNAAHAGAWDLLMRRPDLAAAAVPICGGADNSRAGSRAHVPVWVWHGDAVTVVKPGRSRSMVQALKEAGADPIYTELPGVGDGSWNPAFAHDERLLAEAPEGVRKTLEAPAP